MVKLVKQGSENEKQEKEVIGLAHNMRKTGEKEARKKGRLHKLTSQEMRLFYMALPLIVMVFVFSYLPLFGWTYAFFDYIPGVPVFKTDFAGLKNFSRLFRPGNGFVQALKNTLVFGGLKILISPLPIVFAILLSELKNKKWSKMVQTVTSLPNFISWVLVFGVFFIFFSSDGFVNTLLMNLNIIAEPINFLGDAKKVYLIQTLIVIWKSLGWSAIIYIASMSSIDRELYDAAGVDGAGRLRKTWHITVPGLMPTYIVLLLLDISGILNSGFEQYFVFRNPLIIDKIDVIDTFVYMQGIGSAKYSFATAVGIFKTLISVILLFTVNTFSKKVRGESIV